MCAEGQRHRDAGILCFITRELRSRARRGIGEGVDGRQVAETLRIVDPIPHDKALGHLKADIVGGNFMRPAYAFDDSDRAWLRDVITFR